MIDGINHIGIAVRDLSAALGLYSAGFGLESLHEEEVPEQKVRTAFVPVGEVRLEFLEATGPDSPIARFIETRGEGIHHLALAVDDIHAALERARSGGLRLIDETPRRGAGGHLVAFVHPKSTAGVLIELVQAPKGENHG